MPYIIVHTALATHAKTIAKTPSAVQRLSDPSREERIACMVMASAAASQLKATIGVQLPDLTNVVAEAARREGGTTLLNEVAGSVIDTYDAVNALLQCVPGGPSLDQLVRAVPSLGRS